MKPVKVMGEVIPPPSPDASPRQVLDFAAVWGTLEGRPDMPDELAVAGARAYVTLYSPRK